MKEGETVIIKYFKEECIVHKINKDDTVWVFAPDRRLYCLPVEWVRVPSKL